MAISDCFSQVQINRWSSMVLYQDYRRGTVTGLDSYARVPTVVSTSRIINSTLGKQFMPGGMYITDGGATPELSLINGTFVLFSQLYALAGGPRIFYKTGGGNTIDYAMANIAAMSISAGGVFSSEPGAVVFPNTTKMVAVAWTAGGFPRFYRNGVFSGLGTNAITPVANTGDAYILCSTGFGTPWRNAAWAFLMFNTQLTDAEISRLHDDWLLSRGALR